MHKKHYNLPQLLGAMALASLATVIWCFGCGHDSRRILWECKKPFASDWESAKVAADEAHHAIVRMTKGSKTADVLLIAELRELPDGR